MVLVEAIIIASAVVPLLRRTVATDTELVSLLSNIIYQYEGKECKYTFCFKHIRMRSKPKVRRATICSPKLCAPSSMANM